MFEFAASDLQKCVKDVFVSVSYKDVGLTRKQYIACENIDFCAALQWTTFNVVEVAEVLKYGFTYLEDYRLANVRCKTLYLQHDQSCGNVCIFGMHV